MNPRDAASGPTFRWWFLAILFTSLPLAGLAQTNQDYEAALQEATQRYRGDIPTPRDLHPAPLLVPKMEEIRHLEQTEPEFFAPKPFLLSDPLLRADRSHFLSPAN